MRFLKWLLRVLNAWSFRHPTWTRDDPWSDVSEWYTWPVNGYWHDAADAGWMWIGKLLKVEQDPMGEMNLYVLGTLVYWTYRQSKYRREWSTFNDILYHGWWAWEVQTGPLVWQWFYVTPTDPHGLVCIGRFRLFYDMFWFSEVRYGVQHSWRNAMMQWRCTWFEQV